MNPASVVDGFTSTVLAAAFVAVVAWVFSWVRNSALERKLKEAIDPNGVGVEFDRETHKASFSLQVHNYADATIRVRAIVFIADRFHVELEPDPNGKIYQTPLSNEITRKKFKRKHLSKGSLEPDNNPNAVLLPPKTMSIWRVPSETIGTREWTVVDIFMVFEYSTIFGNSALVRMRVGDTTLKLVKDNFEPLSSSLYNKRSYDFFPERLRKA
jgi:hypothetical protein